MQTLDLQPEIGIQWCSVPLYSRQSKSIQPQPDDWVQLLNFPSFWDFEQALLLCQKSDSEWIVWIPEYGEATLHVNQFCLKRY